MSGSLVLLPVGVQNRLHAGIGQPSDCRANEAYLLQWGTQMSGLQCLFCDHDNPVAAKYCMECGSQLNLRLCKQCEAINDRTAQCCHNCGIAFLAQPVAEQSRLAEPATEAVPLSVRSRKGNRTWLTLALVSALLLAGIAYFLYRQPSLAPSVSGPIQRAPAEVSAGDTSAHSVIVSPSEAVTDASIGNSMTDAPNANATPQPLTQTKPFVARSPGSYGNNVAAMTRGPRGHNRSSVGAPNALISESAALSASSASEQPVPSNDDRLEGHRFIAPPQAPASDSALPASSASKQRAPNNDDPFKDHHFIAPPQ